MIFRRRKRTDGAEPELTEGSLDQPDQAEPASAPDAADAEDSAPEESSAAGTVDLDALDQLDWREDGPWDVSEVDLDEEADTPRVDLGSIIISPPAHSELRLQVAEQTQQVVSAMVVSGDSALDIGAYAAPRSGGLWPELREDLTVAATEAGGSVSLVEGPFGVELRRLLPVQTPDGQQGYQPSRMWVVEGPRWMLRGIVYGQAALDDDADGPAADLLDAFRKVIVRRDDQAMAPGDLMPLSMPQGVAAPDPPEPPAS